MQCAPLTPFPHCTEPHCVPPCTPHPASKRQITTTTEGGEDEWGWMNVPLPPPPCAHTPSTSLVPLYPSLCPWRTVFVHALLCYRPLLTPYFEGLCYDCGRCVLHTYLLAPLLRRDAHIKDCHFQRSGVSPAHKCCPDTWSGKIKTACLTIRVLCLSTLALTRRDQCLGCPFPFLLPPPSSSFPRKCHCCREIKIPTLCHLAAKEEVMDCYLVCLSIGTGNKCDTTDFNRHYYTH